MLSAKQGGIKYHFLNLWYDLTRDWTPVKHKELSKLLVLDKNDWNYIMCNEFLPVFLIFRDMDGVLCVGY